MNFTLLEIPQSSNTFLRFQVGQLEMRQEEEAVWQGKSVTGYVPGPHKVQVFRLLGFGESLPKAVMMAARVTGMTFAAIKDRLL